MPETATRRATTSVKVVVTGPYGVGKTTLVRTLSEINPITSDRRVSLEREEGSGSRTVAMDFGRITVDGDLALYLFAAAPHEGYDLVWSILGEGILGVVILLDQHRPDSYDEAIEIVDHFRTRPDVPYVIGINRVPEALAERTIRRVRHQLRLDDHIRVLTLEADERDGAKALLLELFHAVGDRDGSSGEQAPS